MADEKKKWGKWAGEIKRLTLKNTSNEYFTEKEKKMERKPHSKRLCHELSISCKYVEAYRLFKLKRH